MAESESGGHRITLSEERLRLALSEVEWRIRAHFDERMNQIDRAKADVGVVADLAKQVDSLDRGDFTDVHKRALTAFIDDHRTQEEDAGWTRRERALGVFAVLLSAIMLFASIYFGVRAATKTPTAQPQQSSMIYGIEAP